jgi:hypothetical protein
VKQKGQGKSQGLEGLQTREHIDVLQTHKSTQIARELIKGNPHGLQSSLGRRLNIDHPLGCHWTQNMTCYVRVAVKFASWAQN